MLAPVEPVPDRFVTTAHERLDCSVREASMGQKRSQHPLFGRGVFTRKYFLLAGLLHHAVEHSVSPPHPCSPASFSLKLTPFALGAVASSTVYGDEAYKREGAAVRTEAECEGENVPITHRTQE